MRIRTITIEDHIVEVSDHTLHIDILQEFKDQVLWLHQRSLGFNHDIRQLEFLTKNFCNNKYMTFLKFTKISYKFLPKFGNNYYFFLKLTKNIYLWGRDRLVENKLVLRWALESIKNLKSLGMR